MTVSHFDCVWNLVIQHSKLHAPYYMAIFAAFDSTLTTLYHKRHGFRTKTVTGHKMCVLIFSTTFVLRRTEREIIRNAHRSSRKVS